MTLFRRSAIGLAGTAASVLLLAAVSHADEVGASGAGRGIVVHGPDEVRARFCREVDGVLWLELPGGERFELITDPADAAISNPGDGAFHAFDEFEVRSALASVRYPLEAVGAEIYLLPYPRRFGLESAAGPGIVLLAPGMQPLAPERQHAELAHELGHVVHHRFLPDGDLDGWARYRAMRGIADDAVYGPAAPHANRPHEIFAEDFRALFGDASANYSGTIENPFIAAPSSVAGLDAFLVGLTGPALALAARPNPSRGEMVVTGGGPARAPVDVFDLAGRRLATLDPQPASGGWTWRWDGRDAAGSAVGPGVVLARVRGASSPPLRITRVR